MHVCSVKEYDDILRTRDGWSIGIRLFHPKADGIGKVVVVGPGAGIDQTFYAPFARYLSGKGFTVLTFDYRGVGASASAAASRRRITLRNWAQQDLNAVLLYARNTFAGQELILVGHGCSGSVAGLAPASEIVDRIVLVSSALLSWRLFPLNRMPGIALYKMLVPLLATWRETLPGRWLGLGSELPAGVMRELMAWCNYPNGLFDVFPDNNYRKMRVPLLAFSFTDDWFSPPRAVAALLSYFSTSKPEWLHLQPETLSRTNVGHSGFFEPASVDLWRSMLFWIEAPAPVKNYFF